MSRAAEPTHELETEFRANITIAILAFETYYSDDFLLSFSEHI